MSTVPVNAHMTVAGTLTASGPLRDKGGFAHNVKAYGAVGDGTTNDRPAIQAAIDACKDDNQLTTDSGGLTTAGMIVIPPGRYALNAPLNLFSGQTLCGVGPASRLITGTGWSGSALVLLSASGGYYSQGCVQDLGFDSTTPAWAIANAPSTRTLNSTLQRLSLLTRYGISLTYYAQMCTVADIYSYGPIEQLLSLRGNFNVVARLDKESGTGTSTEPYILVEGHGFGSGSSFGNRFEHLLIEGDTSANKTLIKFDNTGDTLLHHVWFEPTFTDGYGLRIVNSAGLVTITGALHGLFNTVKVQIANSPEVRIARLDVNAQDCEWWQRLEVDSTSHVTIDSLASRQSASVGLLANLHNVRILESYATNLAVSQPAYGPFTVPMAGTLPNLLTNPSFESSGTDWTITGSPTTAEYIASEVGPGLMAHYAWGAVQSSVTLTQAVTIPAAWVGKPLLLSALLKVTTTDGYAHPFFSGVGIAAGPIANYLDGGAGWGIVQQVVVPQSAGTLTVGVRALTMSDFAVDGMTLTFGTEGLAHVR